MRKVHIEDAIKQGYTVDAHAAGGPFAYKGARFNPTAILYCYTELESKLIKSLDRMVKMHALMMNKTNHAASFYDAECIKEMNEAPTEAQQLLDEAEEN